MYCSNLYKIHTLTCFKTAARSELDKRYKFITDANVTKRLNLGEQYRVNLTSLEILDDVIITVYFNIGKRSRVTF